ncbi:hypothetical protein [Neisseria dentiae]|uniref:hypothetical protein n=1 Tax=Neisseria dentiae TaxID=194197 RepID=UPI00211CC9A3|nr:hypothetical protein [Neisseria dentiae]MCQ9325554.1 hypothetical protein [Neisseria dentiae]
MVIILIYDWSRKNKFPCEVETFAKPSDVDAVQGVAAQRAQTYQVDRQASEQRTTKKCAADEGFAKVSGRLKAEGCRLFNLKQTEKHGGLTAG